MSKGKHDQVDMLHGPLLGKLVLFALPLALSSILQQLFNAVDIAVLGQFATSQDQAAVGCTSAVINMFLNLFLGISVGANVVIATYIGQRDKEKVQASVHTAMLIALISGFVMMLVGFVTARPILELIQTPESVLDKAVLYLLIYFAGMPFIMVYNFGAAILRSVGDTKRPLICLTVSGVLNDSPFDTSDSPTIICTEETFQKLTREQTYKVIDIQLLKKASDADVAGLRSLVDTQGVDIQFSDRRESKEMVNSTYWAFTIFVYAFLAVIALITILNIVNSISLSVSARKKQYGIMRAVGMDDGQVMRMITVEAATYGIIGLIAGGAAGLPLYRFLYTLMITHYFGIEPPIPWACLTICLGITVVSVYIAVRTPVKRINGMAITETINEL